MKKKKLPFVRQVQKKIIDGISVATGATSKGFSKAGEHLQKLDEKHGISEGIRVLTS